MIPFSAYYPQYHQPPEPLMWAVDPHSLGEDAKILCYPRNSARFAHGSNGTDGLAFDNADLYVSSVSKIFPPARPMFTLPPPMTVTYLNLA